MRSTSPSKGPPGDRRELRHVGVSVIPRAALFQERWPAGARRARRALEDVKKVITNSDNIRCRHLECGRFRWSDGRRVWLAGHQGPATHVYSATCSFTSPLFTGCLAPLDR